MVKKYTKSPTAKTPVHELAPRPPRRIVAVSFFLLIIISILGLGSGVFAAVAIYQFEKTYTGKIYPGVRVDGISFGGKTPQDVEVYLREKSAPLQRLRMQLQFEDTIATISASDLAVAYDTKLSATQAYDIGRSGYFLSNIYQKWKAATEGINLTSVVTMNTAGIDDTLATAAQHIDIASQDALFQFENGKVNAFKPAIMGRQLDKEKTKELITDRLLTLLKHPNAQQETLSLALVVNPKAPTVSTEQSNHMGIIELVGKGDSTYHHSIPGRAHNVQLAASRIHGHLIAPGTVFSFNDALGDVSAATGYQQAYIIKDGRTVLGDGGGVCQVSTTLFRAAMNSGLPIIEQHSHSYRVGYYEQDEPPGLDATVFSPSYDLKFKNDTDHYLLIQAVSDPVNYTLSFELYGTKDGRVATVTKPVILSQSPAPPDAFQDDPTLPKGVVKQVDFAASGAKVRFEYTVKKGDQVINDKVFLVNYQPWQAVFLRGTKEG